jgi:oligopeptide transport system substrate-binding protein
MFVTGGAMNGGRFSNARYDELIAQASQMPAGQARFDVLAEAERIFIEQETGVMPIYYYVNKDMIDLGSWGGWYANIMGWHPVGDVAAN